MMTDSTIQSLLDELVNAVREGDIDRAREILHSLADRFDELREAERLEVRRSSSARGSEETTADAVEQLNNHILTASETQISRGAFLLEAVAILRELEEESNETTETADTEADELTALGDRLQTQQSEYEAVESGVEDIKETQEIPPQVSIQSIGAPSVVAPETQFEVSTTVTNVGDVAAEDVSLVADLYQDGTKQDERTDALGTIESGEIVETTWTGISDTETILVSVGSSNGGSDTSEKSVLVTDAEEEPEIADYTDSNDIVQSDGLREAVADWRAGEIDTDLLRDVVDAWRSGDPVA